jgi:hypothetical protein
MAETKKRQSWLSSAGYIETARFFYLLAATTFGIGILTPTLQKGLEWGIISGTGVIFIVFGGIGLYLARKGNR